MTFLWILKWLCSDYDFAFDFVGFDSIFLWFWCDFECYLQTFLIYDIFIKINYFDVNMIKRDKNANVYEYSYINTIKKINFW